MTFDFGWPVSLIRIKQAEFFLKDHGKGHWTLFRLEGFTLTVSGTRRGLSEVVASHAKKENVRIGYINLPEHTSVYRVSEFEALALMGA